MALDRTNDYLKRYGMKMTDGKEEIKVYSWDELKDYTSRKYGLVREDIALSVWNMFKIGLIQDMLILQNRLDELEKGGGFVKRDELKSYVFKETQ